VKVDDGDFVKCDDLTTGGWEWLQLASFDLMTGDHTLTVAYSEDGALLDKLCITDTLVVPADKGFRADNLCNPEFAPSAVDLNRISEGYVLGQNSPNPFTKTTGISFEIPKDTYVSLKVFDMLGVEIAELA
jgi:hypothetical protein